MTGPDPYERQLDPLPDATPPEAPGREVSPLAVRHDHSQTATHLEAAPASSRGVAWVRPTELAMRIGSPAAGRGIDLQTELSARARRGTAAVARAARRTSRSSIARPPSTASAGLGLGTRRHSRPPRDRSEEHPSGIHSIMR